MKELKSWIKTVLPQYEWISTRNEQIFIEQAQKLYDKGLDTVFIKNVLKSLYYAVISEYNQ